jgi:hypothetical protein
LRFAQVDNVSARLAATDDVHQNLQPTKSGHGVVNHLTGAFGSGYVGHCRSDSVGRIQLTSEQVESGSIDVDQRHAASAFDESEADGPTDSGGRA